MKGFMYLNVVTSINQTGLMLPCEIHWPDGRKFPIERVIKWRKATKYNDNTTCYTVIIRGQEKKIYFQMSHPNLISPITIGRWFVEMETE